MIITRFLFPCRCLFCDDVVAADKPCCERCRKYIDIVPHKATLPNGHECISAFIHEGVYRQAVLRYKYRSHKQYYIQFAIILSDIVMKYYNDIQFDYYSSVPPHKNRINERSYDQVKLLAKETARRNHAVYKQILYQERKSKSQHTLTRDERILNVRNIYKCIENIDIKDKNILLFDDVVTTGSTLSECTDELIKYGANNVFCVTINW